MAQGQIKKNKGSVPKVTQRKHTGARVIKPKKAAAVKQQKMKKKHSAGLITATEKSLATKAGHLEMLSGGKKDRLAGKNASAEAGKKEK